MNDAKFGDAEPSTALPRNTCCREYLDFPVAKEWYGSPRRVRDSDDDRVMVLPLRNRAMDDCEVVSRDVSGYENDILFVSRQFLSPASHFPAES